MEEALDLSFDRLLMMMMMTTPLFHRFLSFSFLEINSFTDSLHKNRKCIERIFFHPLHIDTLKLYRNYQTTMQLNTFTVDQPLL